jgi:plasmid stabilization system protein ParE
MSFEVVWSPAAEAALQRLPTWVAAERVARAVHALAATGKGDLRRRGTSTTEFALYVGPYCVRLSLDAPAKQIHVWTVFTLR